MIDLDDLLHGSPSWTKVVEFFKNGEFHNEHYLVEAIKTHLRSSANRDKLQKLDLSIEDVLNGRYGIKDEFFVRQIFNEWNQKLGYIHF